MRYRALDVNGDYILGHGRADFLSGADAVAQAVKTRLLWFYGEWWERAEDGLPIFQTMLGQRATRPVLDAAARIIQERIATTRDVVGVSDFHAEYAPGTPYAALNVRCAVSTVYGTIQIEEAIPWPT